MASRLTLFKYLPRTLRPTKEGGYFILLTLGIGLAAVNTGNNLLYLLVALMLSIIVVSGLLSEQSLRRLVLSADPTAPAAAGEPVSILVRLRNDKKRLPSFSLRVDPVPASDVPERVYRSDAARFIGIGPQSTESHPLRITFSRRGCYRLEGMTLSTTFPFGFFIKTAARPEPVELWIYPKVHPVAWPIRLASFGTAPAASHQNGQGAAFHHFRAYQRGDDCRLIHWKLSARQGRWIVKEREREEGSGVLLLFNNIAPAGGADGWQGRFERGVETTASLASALIRAGMKVSIQTADQEIGLGEGPGHLDRILKCLALIEASRSAFPPTVHPRGRTVVRVRWEETPGGGEIPSDAVVGIDPEEEGTDVVR
ncbi:MAG: DUF58 domain-containing protein [Candidatus Manganitrophaceae bacterium]|nr:MAG: DUF58 domain-containing protein [Candidatus Manganitrophaceae bacterium]